MGEISLKLNGKLETKDVADNTLLIDFIREHVGLTGTHVGCDTCLLYTSPSPRDAESSRMPSSA